MSIYLPSVFFASLVKKAPKTDTYTAYVNYFEIGETKVEYWLTYNPNFMHREVRKFIKEVKSKYPQFFRRSDVLEVGSLYINGSVRKFFSWCNYTGIDLSEGRCVDQVCHARDFKKHDYYEVVISCEALEHDAFWKQSLKQMYHNLRPGGLMIITCAGPERKEHGTHESEPECSPFTLGYYGNISSEMFREALPMDLFKNHLLEQRKGDEDLVFYGIKK